MLRRSRPVCSLLVGRASYCIYACRGGAAPAALLRDRRRGAELRPRGRAVAHRGSVAVPADQGARTRPEGAACSTATAAPSRSPPAVRRCCRTPARWWIRPTSCAGARPVCSTSEPVRIGYVNWCPDRLGGAGRRSGAAARRHLGDAVAYAGRPGRPREASTSRSAGCRQPISRRCRLRPASSGWIGSMRCASARTRRRSRRRTRWCCWTPTRRPGRHGTATREQFAADTGARIVRVDDGGVTGPNVFRACTPPAPPGAEQPQGPEHARSPAAWCGVRWSTRHRCGRGRWSGAAMKTTPRCAP